MTALDQSWLGLKVVLHPDAVPATRSWRSRLFSRPWRPWRRTVTVPNPIFEPGMAHATGCHLHMLISDWERVKKSEEVADLQSVPAALRPANL